MTTRRQFIQSALASGALLVAGKKAVAGPKATPKNTQWKTVEVSDKTNMRVFVVYPKNLKTKAPGVIVLQEVFGVNAYIRDVAQRIAALGYVVAAPELFHRTAPGFEGDYENAQPSMDQMQKMTDAGLEADLHATYDLLCADEKVDSTRIGSVGYCMGGRASFIANAVLPLKVAASYYGAGIAKMPDRAADQHGPILLFWGGKDTHIGRDQQNTVADALKKAGKSYVDVEFADADHGFFCNVRKSYNAEASRESWELFKAFFKEHLG
jgi:carboxymethylenebutenolidase